MLRSNGFIRVIIGVWAAVIMTASGWPARSAAVETLYFERRPAMGTSFEIHAYVSDSERASRIFEEAFAEIERVEATLSNYRRSSELSRINAEAARGPVVTDPEVFRFIERAIELSRETGGAFDITVGRLVRAWGFFRGEGRYPSRDELAAALDRTGWFRVTLDAATRSVRFLPVGLELDPGAIGKGYAIDCVVRLLKEHGVRAALIGSGSSSYYAIGAPPGEKGWPIRVPDPSNRQVVLSSVLLRDQSLSTSGNYEKFFRLNDRIYCHIIDPRTGHPVEGMLQTTVIAPKAADADALSTAVFVSGVDNGARLLEKFPGSAALFLTDKKGSGRVVGIRWPGSEPYRFTH